MKILTKIQNNLSQRKSGWFWCYTVLFAFTCLFVFMPFALNGVDFIWDESSADGYTQHWMALMYLGQWGREIITTLFTQGKFVVPMWDFSIGYGSDIATSMHYYAFGDPLNLLSILVPSKFTEILYDLLVLLRLYLAGLSFSLFCFKMDKKKTATLAGAIAYVFCGYTMFASVRHPFFTNPMIYLPLVLLGVEKILRKERPLLFIFMIFITTISNFYFLYMTVFAVVLYVLIRYFTMERERSVKDFIVNILKYAGGGLLGIGMASIMFLPVVGVLFSSNRLAESGGYLELLYSFNYYQRIIVTLFSGNNPSLWTCLGYTAPIFVAVVVMFTHRKKYTPQKIGFCVLFAMIFIPFFGKMMNGFSYVSNRWTFILAAMVSYIFVSVWDDILALSKKRLAILATSAGVYMALLYLVNKKAEESSFVSLCIIFAIIVILAVKEGGAVPKLTKKATAVILVALTVLGCCTNAYYKYDPDCYDYIAEFKSFNGALPQLRESSDQAVADTTKDDTFVRNEQGKTTDLNASVITDTNGVQYYWSLENGYVSNFMQENALNSGLAQKYDGLNARTYLDALASVKYYVKDTSQSEPYGYKKYKTVENDEETFEIYKNNNPLPLGYTYSSYISKADFEKMSVEERQQAMLQGVVLDETEADLSAYSQTLTEFSDVTVESSVKLGKNVVQLKDGSYLVNKDESEITVNFDGMDNCETYLYAKITDYQPRDKYELFMDECQEYYSTKDYEKKSTREKLAIMKNHLEKAGNKFEDKLTLVVTSDASKSKLSYSTPEYRYSTGQEEFLVNLGYSKKGQKQATVKLPLTGIYKIEELSVICQPMDDFDNQVNALKEDVLENEKIGTNSVTGDITLEEDKILCLSVPYSAGWSATVDGEEVQLLNANSMYMAIPLTAGTHKISLSYKTPFVSVGVSVSMISFGIFIGMATAYISIRKKRKLNK